MGDNNIQLFEDKPIRTAWDDEKEEWYFSIVDVISVLTDQPTQRSASNYWAKLKQRLKEEGADQLLINCQQLKLKSPKDGKNTKPMLLIQNNYYASFSQYHRKKQSHLRCGLHRLVEKE